jgi:hypothetical protein
MILADSAFLLRRLMQNNPIVDVSPAVWQLALFEIASILHQLLSAVDVESSFYEDAFLQKIVPQPR